MRRQLVLGALWVAFWVGVLWAVSPTLDLLDAHSPQLWTVPPSAIVAITTPRAGAQGSLAVGPVDEEGTGPIPDVASIRPQGHNPAGTQPAPSPVPAPSLGLPRWSAEPKPAMTLGRVTMPASPTPGAAASHSLAELVRVGIASTYGPGFGEAWVAIPQGPGWRIQVCGPGACRVLISTDKGPDQRLYPDRVVDLPVGAFSAICGVPWTRGLCSVQVVIEGRAS